MNNKQKKLYELCEKFIKDNKISCGEAIYDMDHIIINGYSFIEEVCDIVGYYNYDTNEIE